MKCEYGAREASDIRPAPFNNGSDNVNGHARDVVSAKMNGFFKSRLIMPFRRVNLTTAFIARRTSGRRQ